MDAKKRVHIPTTKDLRSNDKYMLTSQELTSGDKLKTTVIKGEVYDTRQGGFQVRFTGQERLTADDP